MPREVHLPAGFGYAEEEPAQARVSYLRGYVPVSG